MQFSHMELSAIVKAAQGMIAADGRVDDSEMKILSAELINFGVKPDQLKSMVELSEAMEPALMIAVLGAMNDSQKRYVCGFLASIMVVDGDIDDSEMKFWKMMSTFIGCPTMSLQDALSYWSNN